MKITLVEVEHQEKAVILKLKRGVTNPLNLEFLREISKNLHELKEDKTANSLVLTSGNNKFFSIGFDIPALYELDRNDMKIFYQTYNRLSLDLYTFPKPTIAALTGHAIAGGCILPLCCDYRIISEGHKLMGLNEIKLGVPIPYPGDCILHQIVGSRYAKEIMESGDFYEPEKSLQMGMVDQVLPLEQVLPESISKAKTLGEMPKDAFHMIKRNRVEMVEERIRKHLDEKEEFFLDCWFSDDTRKRLEEAMKKF
jgi:enoyl-CoA hydratase/carnithine racemase